MPNRECPGSLAPMRAQKLEVRATHEQTLTRPAATLSHPTLATPEASPRRVREGLGVRALFQWKFMAPMRVHVMYTWKLP